MLKLINVLLAEEITPCNNAKWFDRINKSILLTTSYLYIDLNITSQYLNTYVFVDGSSSLKTLPNRSILSFLFYLARHDNIIHYGYRIEILINDNT